MVQLGRREVLAMSGVALAGCTTGGGGSDDDQSNIGGSADTPTSSDVDGDGVPDARDDYPRNASYSTEVVKSSDRIEIGEDEWYRWNFNFSQTTEIQYDLIVREGPNIDAIWFSPSEYEYYKNEQRAEYQSPSALDTASAEVGPVTVSAGEYYFVLDNTNWGGAAPPTNFDDDVAVVEIDFLAAR